MMPESLSQSLLTTLEQVVPFLQNGKEPAVSHKPSPDKWSPKEIMGHLIDSAANNHQRFVRLQHQEKLVFPGYRQVDWVSQQAYQKEDWKLIIGLWELYNRHLAHVIAEIPAQVLNQSHTEHNLHQIAFRKVPAETPTNLYYFIQDYIAHLEHHIAQIRALGI